MGLHLAAGLNDEQEGQRLSPAAERYLACLPADERTRSELRETILARCGAKAAESAAAMCALHEALADIRVLNAQGCELAATASVHARLMLAYPAPQTAHGPVFAADGRSHRYLRTTPPICRTPMVPRHWPGSLHGLVRRIVGKLTGETPPRAAQSGPPRADSPDARGRWRYAALARGIGLFGLVAAQTLAAVHFMTRVLPSQGVRPLEIAALVLFAVLFAWISIGLWIAIAGFAVCLAGGEPYSVCPAAAEGASIDPNARTAIVMPIANESVARVFAGLRATYRSLEQTGALGHFDFFILSDSNDADTRVAETKAWLDLCAAVQGFGRIYYRWRRHRIKRKSGNLADFCRRWGRNYRYMIVLDADSVMTGESLVGLLRMSEANPNAGIIQTAPCATGRDTLYARVQQFAARIYGPLFTAGLHFWHLGESHYWGHNAIIRMGPFMRHCALGRIRRENSAGWEILSHDTVEAVLMRRAGWAVWIAYELAGSYEELPSNLIDDLKRDRRWCRGNLINFKLFAMPGMYAAHRALLISGVMMYASAFLWFLFLVVSTALLAWQSLVPPKYFAQPFQLFPNWPQSHPSWALELYAATATVLIIPKVLGFVIACSRGVRHFGGRSRMLLSMAAEIVLSALYAPIRMVYHARFVVEALWDRNAQWSSQARADTETSWKSALREHGPQTALGLAWLSLICYIDASFLLWLLPVAGALAVSIPLSVYSSRTSLGRCLRRDRLFLIPEESAPPREIQWMRGYLRDAAQPPGFVAAVVDPIANALACACATHRRGRPEIARRERGALIDRALMRGPGELTDRQKSVLLDDPDSLSRLHFAVWTSKQAHPSWFRSNAASS